MTTRQPAVAGMFYPASPVTLRKNVSSYLRTEGPQLEAAAVVAPHAGYMYSGAVAGAVYSAVKLPDRFIILGPNHTGRGEQLSLHPEAEWQLPFGVAVIDEELNRRLRGECPLLRDDHRAHEQEHSLEVQIPFLQALGKEVRFAAICVGTARLPDLESLGHALARVIRSLSYPVLMIASSDMNHFEPAAVGRRKDEKAIERVLALDPPGLYRTVLDEEISMCGFAPTVAVLTACGDLGCKEGRLIRYANSGDVSGDYANVVGYAGIAILSGPSPSGA